MGWKLGWGDVHVEDDPPILLEGLDSVGADEA
jgi:hypothetical protein